MPLHLALLGLGRLGLSLGLALRGREAFRVTGFDPDPAAARLAQSQNAVQRAEWNLLRAAEGADLVVVALPLAEQREVLAALAPGIKPGAALTTLAPLLGPPLEWAAETLAGRSFAASHPILSPAQLHTGEAGPAAARADLFARGLWTLAPAPGCAPEALDRIGQAAQAAGAAPYFVDPVEHDGLMGAVDALPTLLAAALLRASAASPGWGEMRKVADRGFATAATALADAEAAALRLNRDNALRYLDAALAELTRLRETLAAGQWPALEDALAEAGARRAAWLAERAAGEWEPQEPSAVQPPTAGEMFGRMFLGGLAGRGKKP